MQPSGSFPSLWTRPAGSFLTGMTAALKARLIHSFRAWCLTTRLGACLQTNPLTPVASTKLPQRQVCGVPSSEPSLSATAIRTASSSSRNPHYYDYRQCSSAALWQAHLVHIFRYLQLTADICNSFADICNSFSHSFFCRPISGWRPYSTTDKNSKSKRWTDNDRQELYTETHVYARTEIFLT